MESKEEQPQNNCIFDYFIHTSQHDLINITLDFLDIQEIIIMAEIGLATILNSKLFKVAIVKAIMGKYLNKVDRSMFFLFYEDKDFLSIEKNTINSLANQDQNFLRETYFGFNQLSKAFSDRTTFLNCKIQLSKQFQLLFFQPDLPMPKLKRQTIGIFCQTGFQDLLCQVRFPPEQIEEVWIEQPFQQLRNIIAEQLVLLTNNKNVYGDDSKDDVIKKIRYVRHCSYRINRYNWKQYIIDNFKMHNILVIIFALCSHMVITFKHIIKFIDDPFMRFTQFSLRANIYRNIVLSIEEKFCFLFDSYTQFYKIKFKSLSKYPSMNFWRPAFSIWVQNMKIFHPSNQKAYNYIVSKLRQKNLRQFLTIKTQKLPSFFSELKRQIDLETFSHEREKQFYDQTENKIEMQIYFQNNIEMYQTLAKDYIEYMVDISINQYNVHWCGHSEHVIKQYPLFQIFTKNIIIKSLQMYDFIKQIIIRSCPKQIYLNIFKQVVKQDLIFSDQRLFKPCIIKEIVDQINKQIKHELFNMSEYAVFHEEGYSKHKISLDFNEKDGILSYFANKYDLKEDCPKQLNFYYNVQIQNTNPVFKEKEDQEQFFENIQSMEQYNSEDQEIIPENNKAEY